MMEWPESVPDEPGSGQLAAWLVTLVRNREYGKLAELRRTEATDSHIQAGWYGPKEHREVYERVAFLFGVYHRGVPVPRYGTGSLGTAARRIGDGAGRGPDNPGAQRLVSRIVASRRIPWRHLQHTITRLRSCEPQQQPPSWQRLTDDLVRWHDRRERIAYQWSVDFHSPLSSDRSGTNKQTTWKDAST
ncbi:type I-E CRISPR-associated protein Cse2/CasB [Streptomyces sp. NPDC002454]|uniref:type I-E CRISPR-associated protein Cse2/CasB n=1 Tax=Streptomyces sp. NPDC002490 TaxID=3154416 RepID=UPI0033284F09